jgi:hypothetical protein
MAQATQLRSDGFAVEALTERWALLTHEVCRKSVRFVGLGSRELFRWYVRIHRCGPLGTPWTDDGRVPLGYPPRETAALVRFLANIVATTAPIAFADPTCNAAAREAIDVLEVTLLAAARVQVVRPR